MTPLLAQRPRADRAFERMYRRHVGDVYRYALAVMRNPADAEDVTQTTFLNAYRSFVEKGNRPEKPQNWLIAIAHNVCRQRFRQSARRPSEVAFEDDIADTLVDDDMPSGEDIRRALSHLGFNQRAALVMRELEGRSYAEIAEILDLSTSAVETLIFRARRSLASALERPARHRRRLVHSLNAGPLLALKTALAGNVAASVATAVAVAASATALAVATSPSMRDFPPRVTPPVKVEKAKPAAARANLADRSSDEAVFPPAALPSPNGHPKKWAGTHPRANGKDKPKHHNNGKKDAHGKAGSNGRPPSAPPGQAQAGSPGTSASAPASGKGGKG
jgi:RNA polymerase sigma-70 factor (ECF subfamily)